jgi:hypothetical protein
VKVNGKRVTDRNRVLYKCQALSDSGRRCNRQSTRSPNEYLGDPTVVSWTDHRVVEQHGGVWAVKVYLCQKHEDMLNHVEDYD